MEKVRNLGRKTAIHSIFDDNDFTHPTKLFAETFLLGAVRNEDEGQEIEATAERADETLQAMRILEKKSQDLRAKILGAIELI